MYKYSLRASVQPTAAATSESDHKSSFFATPLIRWFPRQSIRVVPRGVVEAGAQLAAQVGSASRRPLRGL
ncbi:hypothetical protein E2C01_076305 [Portunus trituberculatus]|uniref:Uncharacterized protein n=1 Tax=Portunus trituberculatus TaxID=210409 RepID=A0A5B7II77_PORTR|nr:hypothetical protein [Portunus trituberculatus]